MDRSISSALYEQAKEYFPGGVSSPVRAFKSVHGPPLFLSRGKGSRIFDVDGNEFIDFCGSWGPLIHGHAHPRVLQAITATVANGTSFGAPSRCENALGKAILENHRYLDKLRFVSSGTEAVMSAIRLARGFTGRDQIVKFEGCYHGHVDSLLVKAGSGLATFGVSTSAGIPKGFTDQTLVLDLDDLEAFRELAQKQGDQIAAVIIEPVPANNGLLVQRKEYLAGLREICTEYGILLIFDEVISGFRVGFEGAAGHYNIQPDLITMGKVIGGGMPVGAYGGRSDIMACVAPEGDVYQAGTLSGNPVAMAAGMAQLSLCLEPDFYKSMESKTKVFLEPIRAFAADKSMQVVQFGSIFWMAFGEGTEAIRKASQIESAGMDVFRELHRYLLDNGVYLGPSGYEVGFVSSAHSAEDLEQASELMVKGLQEAFESTAG